MKIRLLAALSAALAITAGLFAQPEAVDVRKPDAPKFAEIKTKDGQTFKLVPRDQLRVKNARTLAIPKHLKGVGGVPVPPASYDWTKGDTVEQPVLGNNQYGDCYYVAMAHAVQTWTGARGVKTDFDTTSLVKRYLQLSRGDNGLSDHDIFGDKYNGEFYGGIVGPKGPHKILDHMTVNPSDPDAVALAQWAFGGTLYTASLCNEWVRQPAPGQTWDAGRANPGYGHAMVLNGKNADGSYKCQTWGFKPPIKLTQKGLESSDPELIACFSLEWFDPATGKAPNGLHYVELAALWKTLGGRDLPANPFPGPAPNPNPPTPPQPDPVPPAPAGKGFTGTLVYKDGVLVQVVPGGTASDPAVESDLKSAGVNAALIADMLQLLADIRAKKPKEVILADVLKILVDFATP